MRPVGFLLAQSVTPSEGAGGAVWRGAGSAEKKNNYNKIRKESFGQCRKCVCSGTSYTKRGLPWVFFTGM